MKHIEKIDLEKSPFRKESSLVEDALAVKINEIISALQEEKEEICGEQAFSRASGMMWVCQKPKGQCPLHDKEKSLEEKCLNCQNGCICMVNNTCQCVCHKVEKSPITNTEYFTEGYEQGKKEERERIEVIIKNHRPKFLFDENPYRQVENHEKENTIQQLLKAIN